MLCKATPPLNLCDLLCLAVVQEFHRPHELSERTHLSQAIALLKRDRYGRRWRRPVATGSGLPIVSHGPVGQSSRRLPVEQRHWGRIVVMIDVPIGKHGCVSPDRGGWERLRTTCH